MSNYNIILDIDETLIHTYEHSDAKFIKKYNELYNNLLFKDRLYKITIPEKDNDYFYYGVKRPHLDEFINFCFTNFKIVAIWSAGKEHYVKHMLNVIFPTRKPNIVYSYDNLPQQSNTMFYNKPISKMINDIGLDHIMSLNNTYILDDREDNFLPNPNNGILISPYNPKFTKKDILKDDTSLLDIIETFKKKIFIS